MPQVATRATPHCPPRLTIPGVYSHPPRRAGQSGELTLDNFTVIGPFINH